MPGQFGGLPGQQLVGESLEGLAHHDRWSSVRVSRAEVEVGQVAASTTVPPLGAQDDEIEGVHRFHLQPRPAAAAGGVGRVEVFDHHALVARLQGCREDRGGVTGFLLAGDDVVPRDASQRLPAFPEGSVEQVGAVEVQAVEEVRPQQQCPHLFLPRAAEARHGLLERSGPALVGERQRLAVQHHGPARQPADEVGQLGDVRGDLAQRPGVDADVVVAAVDLDAGPVEFVLDGHGAEFGGGGGE